MTKDDPKDSQRPQPSAGRTDGAGFASPPCFLHELDPSYLGFLTEAEVAAELARLLGLARAALAGAEAGDPAAALGRTVARLDTERKRLGSTPGPTAPAGATGSLEDLRAALSALAPKVGDPALRARLNALEDDLRAAASGPGGLG